MSEASMSEEDASLWEILRECLVPSKFDKTHHQFVPEGSLDRVITKDSILAAMDVEQPTGEDDLLVEFILKRAKKVFAISVFIELEGSTLRRAMLLFKDTEFNDTKLPIEDTRNSSPPANLSNSHSASTSGAGQNILASLEVSVNGGNRIWRKPKIYNFCEHQWKFLAPVFSTAEYNHDLPALSILPFISKHANFDKGSFGQVSKYEIHPNHIKDPSMPGEPGPLFFAVKEILPGDKKDRQKVARHWASEAKALARMNSLNQDHIVRFITAFRRCHKDEEDHYLMFEWADGGNLRNLWNATPQPTLRASLVKATIKQLLGLAKALCATHYLDKKGASYRHGDLKPENILWFRDSGEIGMLKIGDWGEAKGHNIVTELRPSKTMAEYGTRRYEAPEVEIGVRLNFLGQAPKRRSRLYDIWAMGCITLEFIVWLLYGVDDLKRFNQSVRGGFSDNSPFYRVSLENGKKVARVHDAAVQWMDHMARDPACRVGTTALGDLLELVRTGLLAVKLPRRMGSNLANMGSEQPDVTRPSTRPAGPHEPPISSIPSINITPADPVRIPVQPEPEPEGPARLLATDFRKRLEHILGEDEDESYWFTDAPRPPAPASTDDSAYIPAQGGYEYHTEDTAGNMSRPMKNGQSAPEGLVVPEAERVVGAVPHLSNPVHLGDR